jgi:hypothetical protein
VWSCEQGNETSSPIKGREVLNQLNDYRLQNRKSAPELSLMYMMMEDNTQYMKYLLFIFVSIE